MFFYWNRNELRFFPSERRTETARGAVVAQGDCGRAGGAWFAVILRGSLSGSLVVQLLVGSV